MLHILGTGLRGIKSITVEELELIRGSDLVYVEDYTSVAPENIPIALKNVLGIESRTISRNELEAENTILDDAKTKNVCILVVGDPLSATTHNQMRLSAIERGIAVNVVENSSIVTAAPGKAGFLPYRMGAPVSLPFINEKFRPRSVCEKIKRNLDLNLHTLVLLDLKDGRTMYPNEALEELLELEKIYSVGAIGQDSTLCFLSKISQPGERIVLDNVRNLLNYREELSPTVLIVPSRLDDVEERFLKVFSRKVDQPK